MLIILLYFVAPEAEFSFNTHMVSYPRQRILFQNVCRLAGISNTAYCPERKQEPANYITRPRDISFL